MIARLCCYHTKRIAVLPGHQILQHGLEVGGLVIRSRHARPTDRNLLPPNMPSGLEGLVSKRKDSRYRAGRSPDWIKVKNPASPAMRRAKDAFS
jgi:hypothetical protein